MRKFVFMFVVLCFCSALVGCETVKGLGQDIQNTGDNIWDAVKGN